MREASPRRASPPVADTRVAEPPRVSPSRRPAGDAVRAATALAAEDETDLTKVGFRMDTFELLADGYLSVAGDFLTDTELEHLVFAARMVCFTIGLRFLTDHLNGDVYFKTSRENHNLDRARTQLKTVADMEERLEEMQAVVRKCAESRSKRTE